jgi:hypothetical protein
MSLHWQLLPSYSALLEDGTSPTDNRRANPVLQHEREAEFHVER